MRTEILQISGMTCDGCTSKVAHALKAIPGVHDVVVSLSANEAAVRYDEHLASSERLKSAVSGVGYDTGTNTAKKRQGRGGCCG